MEKIITNFPGSEEVIKKFFKFHLGVKKKTKYIYYAIGILMIIIGTIIFFGLKQIFGGILMVSSIFMYIIERIVRNNIIERVTKQINKVAQRITFSNDEITLEYSASANSACKKIAWKDIQVTYETSNMILLYVTNDSALIVLKYYLEKAQREELIAMIRDHIDSKKYKKRR